jgi:DNA-binding PadR family transcriptional regulator
MALAVLELLAEGPKHPYQIVQMMHERGIDRAVHTKGASVYDMVARLATAALIEPVETTREGRRPERTVYRLTEAGADELKSSLRKALEEPTREYPQFGAALMFIGALGFKEEAIKVLERRAATFEADIAAAGALLASVPEDLPRLFLIEEDYGQAMRRAELAWLRGVIGQLIDGTLDWPQILADSEWLMS